VKELFLFIGKKAVKGVTLQMKDNYGLKKCFLMFLSTLFFVSAVSAQEKPFLILDGPDVVQVGKSLTYSVSTRGGTDTRYTWRLGYTSKNAATIKDGILTALNPGIVGIHVNGNDTGATAELHVQVVTNKNRSVTITGPDKVAIGNTAAFSASRGAVSDGNYARFIFYSNDAQKIAAINTDTGELEGLREGPVIIGAMDLLTGLSGEKTVLVVASEKTGSTGSNVESFSSRMTASHYNY